MANRTIDAIIASFNNLLAEMDFQKISVEMIIQDAGVSRSTFYRHFQDKYEVMNANFKNLFDYYVAPERSSNYQELYSQLFAHVQNNIKMFRRALASTGFNCFNNFVYEYSYESALNITRMNRGGKGFTPVEALQVGVFCSGICTVFHRLTEPSDQLNADDAAGALFEMMPESLKNYWWADNLDL
ncbi:MAG: TetR family transcriptional regulator [Firmicutes bacterium]|nr:TetR family transcriptional regulator [Bacillota bacterium]